MQYFSKEPEKNETLENFFFQPMVKNNYTVFIYIDSVYFSLKKIQDVLRILQ